MSTARDEILRGIRNALADSSRAAGYGAITRQYQKAGTLERDELIALFADRLRDYNAGVSCCLRHEARQTIRAVMESRGKRCLLIPRGFAREDLPELLEFRIDEDLSYEELDGSEGVLTGCALAIARTGTIVLRHTPAEGRRALTLLPDYHLCVVDSSQIVETVVEGIDAMAQFPRVPITTISGPSATSDIEMIRIAGVHGPRILDVILMAS